MLRKPSLILLPENLNLLQQKKNLSHQIFILIREIIFLSQCFFKYIIIKFTIINKYHHIVC